MENIYNYMDYILPQFSADMLTELKEKIDNLITEKTEDIVPKTDMTIEQMDEELDEIQQSIKNYHYKINLNSNFC